MRLQFNCLDSNGNAVTHVCDSTDTMRVSSGPGVPCRGPAVASGLQVGQYIRPNKQCKNTQFVQITSIVELGE